jgi:8-oxo-dGTP pyrophosphatase MutT (NUDIX family)
MSAGPLVRTDVLEIYVFRRILGGAEYLQLKRAEVPLLETWQPIIGHSEEGESTQVAMWREADEEAGIKRAEVLGAWAMEGVHPYYLHRRDAIIMSPRFAIEVKMGWKPTLNEENSAARWVAPRDIQSLFMWPGQRATIAEINFDIIAGSIAEEHLRI